MICISVRGTQWDEAYFASNIGSLGSLTTYLSRSFRVSSLKLPCQQVMYLYISFAFVLEEHSREGETSCLQIQSEV